MSVDDLIYICLLLGCIGFGYFYRKISPDDVSRKRWIGSCLGLALVTVVSGTHVAHVLLTFVVSASIIRFTSVKQSHLTTFVFMFSYLLFFRMTKYFNIPPPPGHTNLVQMMLCLKMVGLAFERNTADREKSNAATSSDGISAIKQAYIEDILDLNFEDMFHYAFNYIGVLTGPYYTYRTYRDYFTARYWQHVNCETVFLHRLKWILVYAAFFLTCSYFFPISYALSDEFYMERSVLYRLWYVWPSFFNFRLRIYIGLALSECVCIMAGFGAYPEEFKSRPGGGPKELVELAQPVEKSQFDFETIHNIDAGQTERCWTFKEAMRSYNMCIQYWMAVVVYQRFPNKKFRTLATLGVSSFWHGVHSGYYLCMMGAPVYLPLETMWDKLIRQKAVGVQRRVLDVVFWVSKFFAFSYLGMAFLLMTIDKIWFYYTSVYHFGYILWALMYVAAVMLKKGQRREGKKREGEAKEESVKKEE